jgi:signal transduction histidine kinase/FixJ family two-component response regulator/HPt (histidine-containing phosphotransfer) domain-containing protein
LYAKYVLLLFNYLKNNFLRQKIIIALILACSALVLAWAVTRVAFTEMLSTVENITAPNERLRIVHELAGKITSMDQLQKKQALKSPGNYDAFFRQSKQMRKVLDTLKRLYAQDTLQMLRVASIEQLLVQRDKQFVNYLKVRETLVNNKTLSRQMKQFNALVSKNEAQPDTTIVTTEQKTLTTTLVPEQKDTRGFLGKIFSRKKREEAKSFRIVNEENVKRDTIALSNNGKVAKVLKRSLRAIEHAQRQKSERFVDREAELANANTELVNQMLTILRRVEQEAVTQIELSSIQAKRVVNTGISRISIIMLVFFGLTLVLLYFILTDITRSIRYRKDLEAARDEAEFHGRAKQRFLSNMSHEIRTPLQSIIGYAELIRQQIRPERKDIDAIYYSSEHLLQIVNEVLDYNRIVSGKFTFASETFNIRKLLGEVILILGPHAEKKNLKLKTAFDLDQLSYISGDPFRLKQILLNLIGNAIKFTPNGEVLLSVFYKRKGNDLHFTFVVKDTGIGFSEQDAQVIFGEFEQSEHTGPNVKEGSGLGLAIVKALVEGQEGRIYAKSKKDQGSTFTVYLRYSIAEQPAISLADPLKLAAGMEVWVVDDDQLILDLCKIIFERNNIKYRYFNSPLAMLDAPLVNNLGFVLMDLRMPELSGSELFKRLKPKLNPKIHVYAVTAQVLPEERALLLNLGFDGVVMKPFREQELLSLFKDVEEPTSTESLFLNSVHGHSSTRPLNQRINRHSSETLLVVEPEEPIEVTFDPVYLEKMTFGDKEQLVKILERFEKDSLNDIRELASAVENSQTEDAELLVHRLAGRIAQIGSKSLAAEFRKLEFRVREDGVLDADLKGEITKVIPLLMQLIENVKAY